MKRAMNVFLVLIIFIVTATASFTMSEEDGIAYMREEEKLAQDVYNVLYELWGLKVFKNIAQAEARHTDAVLSLIEEFGYEDPAGQNGVGVFKNKELQALYDYLVEMGSESLLGAVKVGLLVEETDIKDLEELLEVELNARTERVYRNLLAGSENHLRAFYRQLEKLGGDYNWSVLDFERALEILSK
ncbi:MAG TPA: DUF2202 domain-containing protein [Mesotoga sp.]|jgi:hypothetical protein|nr:DUF2202 domain-containing protein [Mesotoga sp.]MDI9375668.1 DUF2202 domain-containing protein [Thermotogota bacterium]MDD4479135.1 DUF2202 domain-containing protein [Mesotoga sp.]HOI62614.1 DUF2202 domain-containing protein [Mesotoga sp.]HOY25632.1 DUF2202 domain-containing protein [Mesotoga sp.]